MDQGEFLKRIAETQTDIFSLDRMLPLPSVYKVFEEIYRNAPNKSTFLDNVKYKRLREGYFALFAAAALNHWENKEHFLEFPTGPENDVNILSVKELSGPRPLFNKMVCDVKEFTSHEKSFSDFIEKKIRPRLKSYSIILGSHRDITDFKPLYDMAIKEDSLPIYIVTAADSDDIDFNVGMVTMFYKEISPMQLEVNLRESIKIGDGPAIVFQDKLRDKMI
ncbi:MAG: hypothetical protein ABSC29_01750 [Minisyncoccia bacterium]|jgi:hypothetical protein